MNAEPIDIDFIESTNEWNQYLNTHPQSNFYQRHEWLSINQKNFGHQCFFLGARQNNQLVGILPLVLIKSKLFGNIISSMPFVNFGGICADNQQISDLLLDKAKQLGIEQQIDYLEIRSLQSVSEHLPTALHKVSMTINLDQDSEVIWNGFKSKHRTSIRKTFKNGVSIKSGHLDLLDDFYQILSSSWKNLGTPIYKKSYFRDILNTFKEDTKIFIAYHDDKPIATAFNGYYDGTVEGMWAGALPEYRRLQPNYALYWEMIKDSCEHKSTHFHLGRSTADSNAEVYKKKWNAYSKQLYIQYILNKETEIPQLNVNNPKFQLAIKAWSKLPLAVTTTLGPLLSRSIP